MMEQLKTSSAFDAFVKRIEEKAVEWRSVLLDSADVHELYRAQGACNFALYAIDLVDIMILEEKLEERQQKEKEDDEEDNY